MQPADLVCRSCFAQLQASLGSFVFSDIKAVAGTTTTMMALSLFSLDITDAPVVVTAKKKKVREPGIVPGHPLPDNGTCKHYKKSFRWFRFESLKNVAFILPVYFIFKHVLFPVD